MSYVNPLAQVANLAPSRVDQGVDYSGSGPLLALGSGTILKTTQGGWPGGTFIALQLADGPMAGHVVYYAENITPSVSVGQQVAAGDVIGTLHEGYPNLEIGWGGGGAAGGTLGDSLAQTSGPVSEGASTLCGAHFNDFLTGIGAPGGQIQGNPTGTCPIAGGAGPSGSPAGGFDAGAFGKAATKLGGLVVAIGGGLLLIVIGASRTAKRKGSPSTSSTSSGSPSRGDTGDLATSPSPGKAGGTGKAPPSIDKELATS